MFKEFCKQSLNDNFSNNTSISQYSDEEALMRFKEDLKEKGQIEIPSYLKSNITRIVTLTNSGSIGVIGDTIHSYSDNRILQYMRDKDRSFFIAVR